MNANVQKYAKAIEDAKTGHSGSERFLRMRLKHMADAMTLTMLVAASEAILACRREELRSEAELN